MNSLSCLLGEKPLVTFALFSYNQERYIGAAIDAALSQTYEPLEIIISDDCSSDGTFEVIEEKLRSYCGPHKVVAVRNEVNLGIGRHVSKVVREAAGVYVVFAAGDDISKPDRVDVAVSILVDMSKSEVAETQYSFLSTLTLIDSEGGVIGNSSSPSIAKGARLSDTMYSYDLQSLLRGDLHTSGPSRVIPKSLHVLFGDIRDDCFTEDIIYLFRSVLCGKVIFSSIDTVLYRIHGSNISHPKSLYAKSFDGVAAQLRADLAVASDKGLLSLDEIKSASRWIDDNVSLRKFYKRKVNDERPYFSDFLAIMRMKNLSIRRKFGIVREYMGIR